MPILSKIAFIDVKIGSISAKIGPIFVLFHPIVAGFGSIVAKFRRILPRIVRIVAGFVAILRRIARARSSCRAGVTKSPRRARRSALKWTPQHARCWSPRMAVLPDTHAEFIAFCLGHATTWASDPSQVGLLPSDVDEFAAMSTNLQSSLAAAIAAREASRAATVAFHADLHATRNRAGDLIRIIKGYAESQANSEAVYARAQIPPPAAPSPNRAPEKPTRFETMLNTDGSVTLSWECAGCSASTGGYFTVLRRLPGQAEFTLVGIAAGSTNHVRRPNFTDATIPALAAAQGAQYIIQGFRGTKPGTPSEAITVLFGVDGTEAFRSATVKLAA